MSPEAQHLENQKYLAKLRTERIGKNGKDKVQETVITNLEVIAPKLSEEGFNWVKKICYI
jgi:hypothetical protein